MLLSQFIMLTDLTVQIYNVLRACTYICAVIAAIATASRVSVRREGERTGMSAQHDKPLGYVSPRSCWPKSAVVDRQRCSSYAAVMPDSPLPAAVNKCYRPIYGHNWRTQ